MTKLDKHLIASDKYLFSYRVVVKVKDKIRKEIHDNLISKVTLDARNKIMANIHISNYPTFINTNSNVMNQISQSVKNKIEKSNRI